MYRFHGDLAEGTVIDRPNRFIVNVVGPSGIVYCHLHDPGRLEELIYPGNRVLIRETVGVKTDHSITAALNNSRWIITDTRIHSEIASKFLPPDAQREVKLGRKRLDFKSGEYYIEVKGCTLMISGKAMFPDAPTKRGREHMDLLAQLAENGQGAVVLILVMRDDVTCFAPNWRTDPEFTEAFERAMKAGVERRILTFSLSGNRVIFRGEIGMC
ncbi:MAG: DNA/RNA nuclease SfsA [Thermoplasmataceae archaeon]